MGKIIKVYENGGSDKLFDPRDEAKYIQQSNGWVKPDSGDIKIFEKNAKMSSPKDAINLGIGMVHQHFMLAKNLTVLENIILGIDRPFLKNIKLSKYRTEIQKVMELYSLNID